MQRKSLLRKAVLAVVCAAGLVAVGALPAQANGGPLSWACGTGSQYFVNTQPGFGNSAINSNYTSCGTYGVRVHYEVTTSGQSFWTTWVTNSTNAYQGGVGWPIWEGEHNTSSSPTRTL